MSTLFSLAGTITSIGELRQSQSGSNYLRVELRINSNELVSALAFNNLAKQVQKFSLGTDVIVTGTIHGTKESINARYIDTSLFINEIHDIVKDSVISNSTNKNNNIKSDTKTKTSTNKIDEDKLQKELVKKEQEVKAKTNQSSDSITAVASGSTVENDEKSDNIGFGRESKSQINNNNVDGGNTIATTNKQKDDFDFDFDESSTNDDSFF